MSRILFFKLSPRILASAVLASGLTVSENKKSQKQQPLNKSSANTRNVDQGPVTLLSFGKDGSINFNVTGITSILEKVKDLPIVVYSINARNQIGKSYLLNQFVRYLNFEVNPSLPHPNESSQWFTTDPAQLEEFSWTKAGNEETNGIQMWSEPFIVSRNGEKVAVLLLDCQNLYDRSWPGLERFQNYTIIAISQILSSVSIFNVKKEVDKNLVEELIAGSNYNLRCYHLARDMDQRLIFLIQDWDDTKKFGFGHHQEDSSLKLAQGLRNQLDQKSSTGLDPINYHSQFFNFCEYDRQTSGVRLRMKTIIENISMYLMPDPGHEFRSDSVPSEKFQLHFKKFIHLLNSDPVAQPKKSLGNYLTGKSMKRYVEVMATMFKRYDDFPVVNDYFDYLVQSQTVSLVMDWVEETGTKWKKENPPPVSEEMMNEFIVKTESEAKDKLDKLIVVKKKKLRKEVKEKYLTEFDKKFQVFSERLKTQSDDSSS